MDDGEIWVDDEAGPLVRPYTVTRGRTRSPHPQLQMITLVVAVQQPDRASAPWLNPEQKRILALCRRPTSVAEVSATVHLPLSVVRILLSDLIEHGLIVFRTAVTPDLGVLRAVIQGIRQL